MSPATPETGASSEMPEDVPVSSSHDTSASKRPAADPQEPAARRGRWLIAPTIVFVLIVVLRTFVIQPFSIPSGSMEPGIEPGDRILVNKLVDTSHLTRGDIIVFDGTTTWAANEPVIEKSLPRRIVDAVQSLIALSPGTDYVKRVVGLPGDRVVCCTVDGKLSVNGIPVDEPYLYPGDQASSYPFDIVVPEGRLWVMGDHRSGSADSRAHLGDPGGGTIPFGDVVGTVVLRYWPPSRAGSLPAAPGLASIPQDGSK